MKYTKEETINYLKTKYCKCEEDLIIKVVDEWYKILENKTDNEITISDEIKIQKLINLIEENHTKNSSSNALKDLKELHELAYGNGETSWKIDEIRMSSHIKQALLKAQEQEKVLEIIKEYQVDIWLLLNCNYNDYIRIRKECLIENKILVDNEEKIDILPEDFFYYLKRYVCKSE